ncbi:MAG TPA: hypothetical protein VFU41_07770 [Gemmatimonadales bacterium]|nr:hypothetical protein [Gemmatimonadales bacterium]
MKHHCGATVARIRAGSATARAARLGARAGGGCEKQDRQAADDAT